MSGIAGIGSAVGGLFGFFSGLLSRGRDRRNIRQGRMEERLEGNAEVLENVQKAKDARTMRDDNRDERLRGRFDRSRREDG